jgi:hypothetical protein
MNRTFFSLFLICYLLIGCSINQNTPRFQRLLNVQHEVLNLEGHLDYGDGTSGDICERLHKADYLGLTKQELALILGPPASETMAEMKYYCKGGVRSGLTFHLMFNRVFKITSFLN